MLTIMISIKSTRQSDDPSLSRHRSWIDLATQIGRRSCVALITAVGAMTGASAQPAANAGLPVVQLTAGMHLIQAEVAATARDREIGLMNRPTLPAQAGMLFVFEDRAYHCFWMKNTLVPLSIAFLDDEGRIVNIADMKPQSEVSHCPRSPVRYALEMNQGWFAKKGLNAGNQISGLAGINVVRR